jgi:hypothetical protein
MLCENRYAARPPFRVRFCSPEFVDISWPLHKAKPPMQCMSSNRSRSSVTRHALAATSSNTRHAYHRCPIST